MALTLAQTADMAFSISQALRDLSQHRLESRDLVQQCLIARRRSLVASVSCVGRISIVISGGRCSSGFWRRVLICWLVVVLRQSGAKPLLFLVQLIPDLLCFYLRVNLVLYLHLVVVSLRCRSSLTWFVDAGKFVGVDRGTQAGLLGQAENSFQLADPTADLSRFLCAEGRVVVQLTQLLESLIQGLRQPLPGGGPEVLELQQSGLQTKSGARVRGAAKKFNEERGQQPRRH